MNSLQLEETINTSDDDIKCILSSILNMNMWNETKENIIVSSLNKLLTVSKSRLNGLEFLNLIIDNCSRKAISENGVTWISHCLMKSPNDDLKELKLITIGKIVENCYEEQEFRKKFISEHIPKILALCISTHSNYRECSAALNVLAICMKYYGSSFINHKPRIECYLIKSLEYTSEDHVEFGALAFLYLQQVGGAGIDGIKHKTNFSTNFGKLFVTVQKLFDKLFENEIEIGSNASSTSEAFEFTDLPQYTGKMLPITTRRIKNCLTFARIMLLKGFSVEKEITPGDVLDIISRGTAIHRCLFTGKNDSLQDFQFSILLNEVQIELLRMLHVLIVWLHGNALPFSFTITKILVDCLKGTQQCLCFKAESLYQEMIYKVLGCWIRISKGAVHSHFQSQLVKCILKEITPVKNSISLSLPNDMNKNKSKKAIQKAVEERIISSGQAKTSGRELTNTEKLNVENNCLFALDTLKHLLMGTILKISPNMLQELYTSVIGTIMDIQNSVAKHPYTNQNCEAKLYEVLVAFYEQTTLKTLPPLHLTINIFNKGINGRNRAVALTCEQGLSVLEKMCQPICPSLFILRGTALEECIQESETLINGTAELSDDSSGTNESNNDDKASLETTSTHNANEKSGDTENEYELPGSLERNESVHIVDVHVLNSESDSRTENLDPQLQRLHSISKEMNIPSMRVEIVDCEEFGKENIEPPLKRFRTNEDPRNCVIIIQKCESLPINDRIEKENTAPIDEMVTEEEDSFLTFKQEQLSQEAEDDIFVEGEDDFLHEVRNY